MTTIKRALVAFFAAGILLFGAPTASFAQSDWTDAYTCSEINTLLKSLWESYNALKQVDWQYYQACTANKDQAACEAHDAMVEILVNILNKITLLQMAKIARC